MSNSLSSNQIELIKASVPVLAEHGTTITKCFYANLFKAHPELLNMFNQSNQKQSKQQQALANTLYAAAANIENLQSLLPVVRQIAQKHRSLQVKPEHYPIVGHHLLHAIKETLGDAATDELLKAWEVAYGIIADIFMSVEKEMYLEAQSAKGGWEGYRRFIVKKKQKESDVVTSFYLVPEDDQTLPDFLPGQYVTVKGYNDNDEYTHLRQYSLSDMPGKGYFRLSIKREGTVSEYMHHQVEEGAVVELTAPAGEFTMDLNSDSELVLLSAGIGVTPLLSMLKGALQVQPERAVQFIHATRNESTHVFQEEVEKLGVEHSSFEYDFRYTERGEEALITSNYLKKIVHDKPQQFYICGPVSFVNEMEEYLHQAGVSRECIHYEVFTPLIPV
ncbi:NO-inducible flavohemoprotein [Alkalicoccobacillus murimartini]|uniref:nitric oxide dioxygenase n=1 Tax=Alkalicoccobacillus murimartini TaxID=171685 RepID=A0ABT9YHH8_9BACI|nr:NO-inducible flavohemoprotein [Alkalicoccobacillus murimartini]MDQ0207322.1 nitric oxide dioxygenase [Alkalicoccobacillus murimartini]